MAMHNTNSLLKYVAIPTIAIAFLCILISTFHHKDSVSTHQNIKPAAVKNVSVQVLFYAATAKSTLLS